MSVKNILITLLLIIQLFCLSLYSVPAYGVKCYASGIVGYEKEKEIAQSVLGDYVHTVKGSKIFFISQYDPTTKHTSLYIHSNYLTDTDSKYPVKISLDDKVDLYTLILNIYYTERPSTQESLKIQRALEAGDVSIIINSNIINSTKYKYLLKDIVNNNVKNIKFKMGKNSSLSSAFIINSDPPKLLYKYNKAIAIDMINSDINKALNNLDYEKTINKTFNFDNIKLLSLVKDSSAEKKLNDSFSTNLLPFDFSSAETFFKLLSENKDRNIILLGHIENNTFVTRNSNGDIIFQVPIQDIMQFQKANDVNVFLVGCNSGLSADSGVLNKFNIMDILANLDKTRNSKNTVDFLNGFASDNISCVISNTLIENLSKNFKERVTTIEIYDNSDYETSIGHIIIATTHAASTSNNTNASSSVSVKKN